MQLSSPPFSIAICSFLTTQMDAAPSATSSESPLSHKFQSVGSLMNMNLKDYLKRVLKRVVWSATFDSVFFLFAFPCAEKESHKNHAHHVLCLFHTLWGKNYDWQNFRFSPAEVSTGNLRKHSPSFSLTHTHTHTHSLIHTNTSRLAMLSNVWNKKKNLWRLLNHFEAIYIHSTLGDCLGRHMCVVLSI